MCNETVRIANKDRAELRIGYLKCYSGQEFRMAVAEFSEKYPDVSVQIINGNHEDLYAALRDGGVDLILSDQRRAFLDEYVNFVLTTSECYIEIAARNPIAALECVEAEDLKNIPCILVASPGQQDTEQTYYREVVGIQGDFAPGIVVTPLALDEFNGPRGDFYKNMFANCPAGRPGTADEIANVAELLVSDKGAFITGSTFLIDGGATASYFYGPLAPEK